jgi:hypothetical protein
MPSSWIDVEKSSYHYLSQTEIDGDKHCSRQLSGKRSFASRDRKARAGGLGPVTRAVDSADENHDHRSSSGV